MPLECIFMIRNFKFLAIMVSCLSGVKAGTLTLDGLDTRSHASLYNSLPSVEYADESIKKRGAVFEQFLTSAKDLVLHYGMEQHMGLRLIHRHYELRDREVMVEEFERIDDIPSLVTEPRVLKDFSQEALPTGWIFSSPNVTTPVVFESSTDKAVKLAISKLSSELEFMEEVGSLIRSYQLEGIIALGIVNRDSLVMKDGEILLEINSVDEFRSVVQAKQVTEANDFIRTGWSFCTPVQHGCHAIPFCVPTGGAPMCPRHIRTSSHQHY